MQIGIGVFPRYGFGGGLSDSDQGRGQARGLATVLGVGASIAEAAGLAEGQATAVATSLPLGSGVGTSAGIATVAGVGRTTAEAVGTSQGSGVAVAVGQAVGAGIQSGAGSSTGSATVSGVSQPPVNPVISTAVLNQPGAGAPDNIAITGTYSGTDQIDGLLEFYDGATLIASVIVEDLTVTSGNFDFSAIAIDEGALTYESTFDNTDLPGVDSIDVTIYEATIGGTSTDTINSVTGLDGTPPAAPTWATNAAGTQYIGTFAEVIYGAQDLGDFSFGGVSAGAPTVDSVTGFGTNTITVTVSGNLPANGDTLTISYTNSDSDLRDAKNNLLANISGASVTNNVPAGSSAVVITPSSTGTVSGATGGDATWEFNIDAGAGGHVAVAFGFITFDATQDIVSATIDGQPATMHVNYRPSGSTGGLAIFSATGVSSGTVEVVVTFTLNPLNESAARARAWTLENVASWGTAATDTEAANGASLDVSIVTTDDGGALAAFYNTGGGSWTISGLTEEADNGGRAFASDEIASGSSPLGLTGSTSGTSRTLAVAVPMGNN